MRLARLASVDDAAAGECHDAPVATRTLAHVTPASLRWARESIGYSIEEAAEHIGVRFWQLEAAEDGVDLLTLRQAEKAADFYQRPLVALFLPEPPEEIPQEQQFRRLPGAPTPPWPPAMNALVRRVRDRQDAAADLFERLEETPAWPLIKRPAVVPNWPDFVRTLLKVSLSEQQSWHDPAGYTGMRRWVDAVESLGVLVMQDGSLDLDQMRGFAALDPVVPAVVLNTNDDVRARVFTLIHELVHLLLDALKDQAPAASRGDPERWCDEIAGEFLMPERQFESIFLRAPGIPARKVDAAALSFGVTPRAALTQASRRGLVTFDEAQLVLDDIRKRRPRAKASGGNPHRNRIGQLGPSYSRLVLTAVETRVITYSMGARLLGAKANHFPRLHEVLAERDSSA